MFSSFMLKYTLLLVLDAFEVLGTAFEFSKTFENNWRVFNPRMHVQVFLSFRFFNNNDFFLNIKDVKEFRRAQLRKLAVIIEN